MTAHVTADALRVARHLTGLSQRDVEQRTRVARKSLIAAETEGSSRPTTLTRLRSFYEASGIEFLGTIDVASAKTSGIGARWRLPEKIPPSVSQLEAVHSERSGLAFAAARALLGLKQSEVVRLARMPATRIRSLETGVERDRTAQTRLRMFYEQQGVEFLGWGDVTRDLFYGVGVRWKPLEPGGKPSPPTVPLLWT